MLKANLTGVQEDNGHGKNNCCLLDLLFDREDGGNTFLWNIGGLLLDWKP
jgi:hypothetical protein